MLNVFLSRKNTTFGVLILGIICNCAFSQSRGDDFWSFAPVGAKIKSFELPLFNDEGEQTGVLRGQEAVILDRFHMQVDDLIYESKQENKTRVFLRVLRGVYDRENNTLSSEANVVIQHGEVQLTGKGLNWNISKQKGGIFEDVRVVINSSIASGSQVASEGKE